MRDEVLRGHLIKRSGGFTLLEVMIALVILAVGLLGLTALQLTAVKSNSFSSEMTWATMRAQQQAEVLRNLSFTDAWLAPGSTITLPPEISKGARYTISWTVSADNVPATNMRTIAITVTWQSLRQGTASQTTAQQTVTSTLRTVVRSLS
jgi:type IV pilus assembly protein PilV